VVSPDNTKRSHIFQEGLFSAISSYVAASQWLPSISRVCANCVESQFEKCL
jgi:hypothetical protein